MTDIKEIKFSLMEKQGDVDPSTGKSDYVMRTSASFKFNEYVEKTYPEADEEDRDQILKEASQLIYQDLLEKTNDKFDSIGVWISVGDQILENSIDIAVLEGIQRHAVPGTVPIYELVKMTLPVNE